MDRRLLLATRYLDAGLLDEAWSELVTYIAEPDAPADAIRVAIAIRGKAQAFEDVVRLCDRLGDAESLAQKGYALHRLARLDEAEAAYRRAIALHDPNPAVWNDLGNVLDDLGRPDDARAAFQRAIAQAHRDIAQAPAFSQAHNNLGAHLASQGRFAAAVAAYGNALAADPANAGARANLGVALLEQGDVTTAVATFDQILAREPGHTDAADNRLYAQVYQEPNPAALRDVHAAWGRKQPAGALLAPRNPDPGRRLRIGYVSPDLRRHSVSFFVEPLLAVHDQTAVEVFCYSDAMRADAVTARLRGYAHHWRDSAAWSHEVLRQRILEDGIDVLVDLAGHTRGNRLPVFALRAAPVQVAAIGYPATTGLPAMDYRLCDAETDPSPNADAFATETLVRLVSGLHCYAPPPDAPAPAPLPAASAGHITFGSFNKLAKISAQTVELWARALRAIPNARLLLKSRALVEEETRTNVAARFAAQGIDGSRLEMLGWVGDDAGHLGAYGQVDIALDTFPYNGTTTTCEALWMGVPVLAINGQGHAGRVGASLLRRAGLGDWLCRDGEDLAARAVAAAKDPGSLAKLRAGLRVRVAASPLCARVAYARAVEAAYRQMWRRACGAPS